MGRTNPPSFSRKALTSDFIRIRGFGPLPHSSFRPATPTYVAITNTSRKIEQTSGCDQMQRPGAHICFLWLHPRRQLRASNELVLRRRPDWLQASRSFPGQPCPCQRRPASDCAPPCPCQHRLPAKDAHAQLAANWFHDCGNNKSTGSDCPRP